MYAQNRYELHHTRCTYVMYDVVHCQIVTIWVSRVETAAKCFYCQTLTPHLASPVSLCSAAPRLAPYLLIADTHYITCQYSALSAHCSLHSFNEFAIFTSEFSNSQLNTMLWNCLNALRYTVPICLPWALCFSRFCNFCHETFSKYFESAVICLHFTACLALR